MSTKRKQPDDETKSEADSASPDTEQTEQTEHEKENGEEGVGEEEIDPDNLLVYQLKEELKRRGLSPAGRKPELVQRLKDALEGKIPSKPPPQKPKKKVESDEEEEESESSASGASPRRGRKRAAASRAATKIDEVQKEENTKGPAKKRNTRGRKKAAETKESEDAAQPEASGDSANSEAQSEPQDSASSSAVIAPITEDDSKYLKIVSWNVNSWAACLKKGLRDYIKSENADIVCLQETKWNVNKATPSKALGPTYPYDYWYSSSAQLGYAGTAVFSKIKPLNVAYGIGHGEHDSEGRTITLEFATFYLVNTYVPNAGTGLKRLGYRQEWNRDLLVYFKKLEETKPVVWCGDLNVAHEEIDLANPKTNRKTPGFTDEERHDFSSLLEAGFVDTWRHQNPGTQGFTFWSYKKQAREKNVGWRLDYFVVTQAFYPEVGTSFIRSAVLGSDHCPIGLIITNKDQGAKD